VNFTKKLFIISITVVIIAIGATVVMANPSDKTVTVPPVSSVTTSELIQSLKGNPHFGSKYEFT
jgi:hypothetical protein